MATEDQNGWVAQVLKVSIKEPDGSNEGNEIVASEEESELAALGVSKGDLWETAVAGFRSATEKVDLQIADLQAVLRETDDVDLHDIADAGLNALTGNTRVPLKAALVDAGTGDPTRLKAATPKLLKAIAKFRAQLSSMEIAACDNNPFDVPIAIADTYSAALDQLVYAVKMAA
jgi:hypothetical protein